MTSEAAEVLLAAGRELRLRCFMGPLPFDVDGWMQKGLMCDLPRLEDGASEYHFDVRHVEYGGTYCKLKYDQGKPCLTIGGGGTYPAHLDGWRSAVSELNELVVNTSILSPRTYIWLHGYHHLARQADAEYAAAQEQAMIRILQERGSITGLVPPILPPEAGRPMRRRRRWPWGRR
ncbi:hypothetical protein ACLGIH_33105 [Streptomyces sp. HMX87]|uniref:hypothetical protein n=1 Tax=Streptomyces sp. HMX87 TaxID=3390849 RepID=UPI003A898B22